MAIAVAALLPANLSAAEPMKPMKGAEHLLMLNEIKSTKDLNALKTDDSIAMVCAKCKTVWVTRVKQGAKGAELLNAKGQPTELIGTHACQGCNSTLTVVGHAKGDITEVKHSCKACGDDSAFCCATRPGAGTKGMEKK
jgi:formate-dependent nitrite reductase cytochrome c552 subunit